MLSQAAAWLIYSLAAGETDPRYAPYDLAHHAAMIGNRKREISWWQQNFVHAHRGVIS